MARVCLLCNKKPMSGKNVAHSKKSTLRKFYPNLQKKKFKFKNKIFEGYICTRCMKTYNTEIIYL